MITAAEVSVGDELPPITLRITRAHLVAYAGASLDFNPIHWNQRFAEGVGLPGVIAHGMLTMGMACRIVTEWAGDPAAVVEYGTRFGRPVPVPDDDEGAVVEVTAKVTKVLEDGTFKVNINASHDGKSVLGGASARVRLP
ncbi:MULTISPECIES: MaoC family dehydratase [Actinosynnema]|uniref:MaoC domain protein dehydratase n=2 Tax=Actinosynnema TaxID=40566 RepID=C6WN79_ACTMD|nr:MULTISPECIES: MaoC family dehydratase [Actinosynnema]ACU40443.1 MaoC domain protein dehydratase [Actinosynnema mirum DSM 43827]ATE57471.1 dehydratase [Actinosynnema pretiosum]